MNLLFHGGLLIKTQWALRQEPLERIGEPNSCKGLLNHRLSKLLSSVIGKRRFYNGR